MILIGENEIRYATQLAFWVDTMTYTDIFSLLFMDVVFCGVLINNLRTG